MYEHADQSWTAQPKFMSAETVTRLGWSLATYAQAQGLESVSVILHGGEPLLVGAPGLRRICRELTDAVSPIADLDLRIHTNGVQLSRAHLEIFKEFEVKVGISLDGDRAGNDRHRVDRQGRSSYDRVLRAIGLLRTPEYRHLYAGLLCTVDVANDPVAVHDALTALEPPCIDYLLPHATWADPPPKPGGSRTPYADWLLAVYDHWVAQRERMRVRVFDSVHSTLRGGHSLTEALGLAPSDLAVVETDGSFEQADSLKTAYQGAPATGLDVFRNSFEELERHPGVQARQAGIAGVSETCRACPVVESCGGGLYAHRYSAERGFDNPSVHCTDLRALVDGIAERITDPVVAPVLSPEELRFSQLELDRGLVTAVKDRMDGHPAVDEAWRTLVRLDGIDDAEGDLEAVFGRPYLRPSLTNPWNDRKKAARYAAIAVAAAIHARSPATLAWDQPDPELYLPRLGTLRLPGPGWIEVTVGPGVSRCEGTTLRETGSGYWSTRIPGPGARRDTVSGGPSSWWSSRTGRRLSSTTPTRTATAIRYHSRLRWTPATWPSSASG
ncbi:FxsB family cyclophane-forming radical SAM/SPASM peptide maturase [Streptomyces sp. CA-249302]|uniref:FxsB family cyclophane-forming radical SAM/SPASM peptide maturase n=1 Tax=Streptomyces sp. CA-249302 TaxID=3240058 RepID=UPI003D8F5463